MGRPPLNGKAMDASVLLRASRPQLKTWRAKARASGLDFAAWARHVLDTAGPITVTTTVTTKAK